MYHRAYKIFVICNFSFASYWVLYIESPKLMEDSKNALFTYSILCFQGFRIKFVDM